MHKTTAYTELRCFWMPVGIKMRHQRFYDKVQIHYSYFQKKFWTQIETLDPNSEI